MAGGGLPAAGLRRDGPVPGLRLACLPWYELPETRAAQDALWTIVAHHLARQGIADVPPRLTRGRPVPALLADPRLLFGQCCGYDVVYGFSDCLTVLATPQYDAAGCEGSDYRSFVLVPADFPGPDAGRPPRRHLRRQRLQFPFRHQCAARPGGAAQPRRALLRQRQGERRPYGQPCDDACRRRRRDGDGLRAARPALPLPARSAGGNAHPLPERPGPGAALRHRPRGRARRRLRACATALADAFADQDAGDPLASLLLGGIAFRPATDYARIVACEAAALSRGYMELHATSPALAR